VFTVVIYRYKKFTHVVTPSTTLLNMYHLLVPPSKV
jgi:hypothetical protein